MVFSFTESTKFRTLTKQWCGSRPARHVFVTSGIDAAPSVIKLVSKIASSAAFCSFCPFCFTFVLSHYLLLKKHRRPTRSLRIFQLARTEPIECACGPDLSSQNNPSHLFHFSTFFIFSGCFFVFFSRSFFCFCFVCFFSFGTFSKFVSHFFDNLRFRHHFRSFPRNLSC